MVAGLILSFDGTIAKEQGESGCGETLGAAEPASHATVATRI